MTPIYYLTKLNQLGEKVEGIPEPQRPFAILDEHGELEGYTEEPEGLAATYIKKIEADRTGTGKQEIVPHFLDYNCPEGIVPTSIGSLVRTTSLSPDEIKRFQKAVLKELHGNS